MPARPAVVTSGGGALRLDDVECLGEPGEAARFRDFTKQWAEKSGVKTKFQAVTGDYLAKLLTQLAGGSAPDAFYAGDDRAEPS